FGALEARRPLREKRARRCVDSLELAAKWREVEPRFEQLVLGPVPLQRDRLAHLAPLLQRIAPARALELGMQPRGELHRDRAAAAPAARSRLSKRANEAG